MRFTGRIEVIGYIEVGPFEAKSRDDAWEQLSTECVEFSLDFSPHNPDLEFDWEWGDESPMIFQCDEVVE